MADSAKVSVGGYQGSRSILTTALGDLCRDMAESGCFAPELTADVTAAGLAAKDLFTGVELGTWDIAYMASGYLVARVPELGLLDLPFAVSDRTTALGALDGRAGALISAAVERTVGIKILGFWDNGFRHMSNNKRQIVQPADCKSLTIRTLDSPIYCASLRAMGFTPVVTDVRDFREAIASGLIDAQENPLTNMLNFGIEAHHHHLSLTGHVFGVALLLCNNGWYQKLTNTQRRVLMAAVERATILQRILAASEDERALVVLRQAGMQILPPEKLHLKAFKASILPIWRDVRAQISKELTKAYLG